MAEGKTWSVPGLPRYLRRRAVGTALLDAIRVEGKRVPVQREAALARDFGLALLDVGVVELFYAPALQADEVVVVPALVQLEYRLAGLEVLARQQAGLLELRQHAVDRGQADVDPLGEQRLVDVLRGKVPHLARLEQLEDLAPGQGRLESAVLQALHRAHAAVIICGCAALFSCLPSRSWVGAASSRRFRG